MLTSTKVQPHDVTVTLQGYMELLGALPTCHASRGEGAKRVEW